MQIKQNRIILLLTINVDPLLLSVHLYIQRFIDAAVWRSVIIHLSDKTNNQKNDDKTKNDNPNPF